MDSGKLRELKAALEEYRKLLIRKERMKASERSAWKKMVRQRGQVVVAITEGRLDFGPWEQIFYGEFDGRRKKRVLVKIIGE